VFTSCIIQIPLRFQSVNNESPWRAGVRLVPFGIAVPIGAGLVAAVCGKRRLPPIYMLLLASVLQILGLVFMSRLYLDNILWNGQYGLQFMTGLGCGLSVGVVTLITPFVIEKQDLGESLTLTLTNMNLMSISNLYFSGCTDSYAGWCASPRHDYSSYEQRPKGHAFCSGNKATNGSDIQDDGRHRSSSGAITDYCERNIDERFQHAAPNSRRICSDGNTCDTADVAKEPGKDCLNMRALSKRSLRNLITLP
jgi:hypothetical protein